MIYMSRNFTFAEFVRSNTAKKKGIHNKPDPQAIVYGTYVAAELAQPLREHLNVSINPTSWFRNRVLNAAVGGVPSSDHIRGGAMDIQVKGYDPEEIIEIMKKLNLPYDQAIAEGFQGANGFASWTHMSVPEIGNKPRRQLLIAGGDRDDPTYEVA